MAKIRYIGDLSQLDAQCLVDNCKNTKRILEYGVGGSTMIMCQYAPSDCEIITIDTEQSWIDSTKTNIKRMEKAGYTMNTYPKYVLWDGWKQHVSGQFDVIFDDGKIELREEFGLAAWKYLKVGGKLIIHDTKMPRQMKSILNIVQTNWLEIYNIETNQGNSNMCVITKKKEEIYYNWNETEKRSNWEKGYTDIQEPPKNLWGEK